ncbi:MAG: type II toxin-antitoxin system VapC family toxin [bacterium]|jgi:predicted nucleic acid-binding protein
MAKIYLDSCIIIYLIQGKPDQRKRLNDLLHAKTLQKHIFCRTELSRMECYVLPLRQKDYTILNRYETFFASGQIVNLTISKEVFDLATNLRADHFIKTPDALHLATAVVSGCQEFWTNDLKLQKAGSRYLDVVIP